MPAVPAGPQALLPTNVTHTPQVKLLKLTMKRFNDDLTKWTDSFSSSIHNNSTLSNIDKFNYLVSLLESTAAEGIAPTDANYEEVVTEEICHCSTNYQPSHGGAVECPWCVIAARHQGLAKTPRLCGGSHERTQGVKSACPIIIWWTTNICPSEPWTETYHNTWDDWRELGLGTVDEDFWTRGILENVHYSQLHGSSSLWKSQPTSADSNDMLEVDVLIWYGGSLRSYGQGD